MMDENLRELAWYKEHCLEISDMNDLSKSAVYWSGVLVMPTGELFKLLRSFDHEGVNFSYFAGTDAFNAENEDSEENDVRLFSSDNKPIELNSIFSEPLRRMLADLSVTARKLRYNYIREMAKHCYSIPTVTDIDTEIAAEIAEQFKEITEYRHSIPDSVIRERSEGCP